MLRAKQEANTSLSSALMVVVVGLVGAGSLGTLGSGLADAIVVDTEATSTTPNLVSRSAAALGKFLRLGLAAVEGAGDAAAVVEEMHPIVAARYDNMLAKVAQRSFEIDGAEHFNELPKTLRAEYRAVGVFSSLMEGEMVGVRTAPSERGIHDLRPQQSVEAFLRNLDHDGRMQLRNADSEAYREFLSVARDNGRARFRGIAQDRPIFEPEDINMENLLLGDAAVRKLEGETALTVEGLDELQGYADWLLPRIVRDEANMRAGGVSLFQFVADINRPADIFHLFEGRYDWPRNVAYRDVRLLTGRFKTPDWFDAEAHFLDWVERSKQWRTFSDETVSAGVKRLIEPELRVVHEQVRQTIDLLRAEAELDLAPPAAMFEWQPEFDRRIAEAERLLERVEDLQESPRLSKNHVRQEMRDITDERSRLMIYQNPRVVELRIVDRSSISEVRNNQPRTVFRRNAAGQEISQRRQQGGIPLIERADYQDMPYASFGNYYWQYKGVPEWFYAGVFPTEHAADFKYFDGSLGSPIELFAHDEAHVLRIIGAMREWNDMAELYPRLSQDIAQLADAQRSVLGEMLWEVILERVGARRGIPTRSVFDMSNEGNMLAAWDDDVARIYLAFRDLNEQQQRDVWKDRAKRLEYNARMERDKARN